MSSSEDYEPNLRQLGSYLRELREKAQFELTDMDGPKGISGEYLRNIEDGKLLALGSVVERLLIIYVASRVEAAVVIDEYNGVLGTGQSVATSYISPVRSLYEAVSRRKQKNTSDGPYRAFDPASLEESKKIGDVLVPLWPVTGMDGAEVSTDPVVRPVGQEPHHTDEHRGSAAVQHLPSAPNAQAQLPMAKASLFISYRRSDEASFAGRLYDRLVQGFDPKRVFMDVDSIELGLDFTEVLAEALDITKIMLVIIGRNWLNAIDEDGNRRLDDPDDYVAMEIRAALERNIRVVPVLVDGARMPKRAELPPSIGALATRNGRAMTSARFGSDSIEIVETAKRILGIDTAGS